MLSTAMRSQYFSIVATIEPLVKSDKIFKL